MKRSFLLLFVCACVVFLVGCEDEESKVTDNDDETTEERDERLPVEVAEVTRGTIEAVVRSSANLEAEESVQVFAKTSGRAVSLLVEEGDQIVKDQVILRLEDEEQKIRLEKAEVRVAKAERDFARTDELYRKELVTSQEYNDATYDLEQAKLELAEAEQGLRYTKVLAPIGGTLTKRMVNLGDMVNTGSAIFEIVDFDSIVARVYLPEKHLATLRVGQRARLTTSALEGEATRGSVKRIAPTVDAKTGTVKVTVGVDDIGLLRPGMYVDVALVVATHEDVVLLPKRALVYDSDQVFVYRVAEKEDETVAERISVDIVLSDRDNIEPRGGISESDRIIVAGQTGLKDGSKIRLLGEEDSGARLEVASRTAEVTP